MNRSFFLSDTLKGTLFGSLLLGVIWGLFVGPQLVFLLEYALPNLGVGVISGIGGGLVGGLIVLSRGILRSYWDWADRVMARLFGGIPGSGEKA